MGEQLGFWSAVSLALGGMVGGGIYAVLGVVAQITMYATWFGFLVAGVVAACAGYSYNRLNALGDERGGSVSFVQEFVGSGTLAGMVGWTLLLGYVASMAMYAFAFAEFAIGLGLPGAVAGVPSRPIVSVAAVAAFVGLNLLGAHTTGAAENVLVGAKVAILLAFGVWGVAYLVPVSGQPAQFGFGALSGIDPIVAAAISFVAFQGWQLLFYDQESIVAPDTTLPRAVSVAIPVAVAIYVLVAVVTVNLAPQAIVSHPHTALKSAASEMAGFFGLAAAGALVISLSALFSTGSAINATLFSAAHFAKGMLQGDLLPDQFGDGDADGTPPRTVLLLGAVTAAMSALGSLGGITSFASLAFIVVFGTMSLLAFQLRDHPEIHPLPPLLGAIGALAFAPLMLWNLYTREPGTFWAVVLLAVLTMGLELLYFERDSLQSTIEEFAEDAAAQF